VSIAFDVPTELKEVFKFMHGQNVTLKATINGEEIRRSYSICSSPTEDELRVAVKKVEDGLFSRFANDELKKGEVLEVLPPTGRFYTHLSPINRKNYLAFAAGSGITPIISIIKTALAVEPHSRFTLVYGNRSRASIIFFEELEALKNKYMERFSLVHILSRERTEAEVNYGRIDVEKCSVLLEKLIDIKAVDELFICGPEEMIFSVSGFMRASGLDEKKIHFELFTTPGQKEAHGTSQKKSPTDSGPRCQVSVKLDGRLIDFELPFEGLACKGGVCATCRAKLVEGEVEMDRNYALEPEELEAGYILTCQSHPRTPKIVVDFDQR
jgi:ring-1,2-phenylacetyl-CoA epoxidase subunit PaaE